MAYPIAQEFRLLAAVNNLRLITPEGEELDLSQEQREIVLRALREQGDQSFTNIRTLLNLKGTRTVKSKTEPGRKEVIRGYTFNLESGGETKIPGDRTAKELLPILGDRWKRMSDQDKRTLVCDII